MARSYDSYDDLIRELDDEGIVDDEGTGLLDDEDLTFLAQPGRKSATPAKPAPRKTRGRPKKKAA